VFIVLSRNERLSTMSTLNGVSELEETRTNVFMTGRQKIILALLLGAQFMVSADFSILNVAIPVIGNDLHFQIGNFQWIATAFALASASFTLTFGRIADMFGRRRMLLIGMTVLVAASLLGGLATTSAMRALLTVPGSIA